MANLPQNSTYSGPSDPFAVGATIKINPPATTGSPTAAPPSAPLGARLDASKNTPALPWQSSDPTQAAKEQAIQGYENTAGLPTEQPGFPSVDENGNPIPVGQAIPVPSDYSGFKPAGGVGQYQWSNPTSPVIKNIGGDVQGQYVEDTANPNALIKSQRGYNPAESKFLLNGRPSNLYQIDHIMPLELGGADTVANREILSFSQNEQKTIAQAVPYTLYAHGLIPLAKAREMAMTWKERDIGGLPNPDNNGLVPLDKAQAAAAKWSQPVADRPKTFQQKMAAIPQEVKDFGKGWLPDPVREFVKGFGSGATFGFLPYEQGENEDTTAKIAGYAGELAGGVASFVATAGILDGALAIGGLGLRGVAALRGAAEAAATTADLVSAEGATAEAVNLAKQAAPVIEKVIPDAPPSYLYRGFVQPLTKPTIRGAAKFATANVMAGQLSQLVQHELNPQILSNQQMASHEDYLIPTIIKDAVIGGVAGVASPTLKGASLAMAPVLAMNFIEDPYHPMKALTSAAVFGAFHFAGGSAKRGEMTKLEDQFVATQHDPEFQQYKRTVIDRMPYNTLSYYANDLYPDLKPGEFIPDSAYDPARVQQAAGKALSALDTRYHFDKNPDGTPADVGMSEQAYSAERARIIASAEHLNLETLPPDKQVEAYVNNILSYAKTLKNKGKNAKGENIGSRFDQLREIWMPKTTEDVGQYLKDNKASFTQPATVPPQGENAYLEADMPGTGQGLKNNQEIARRFFSQEAGWDTLPYVSAHTRPELESVWRMNNAKVAAGNKNLDPKFVADADPNPQHSVQLFGYKQNQKSGQVRVYALGWLPGQERLGNINAETKNWKNPPPPFEHTKDTIAEEMDKKGLNVLLMNIDHVRSTDATTKSNNPFGVYNATAKGWQDSMALRDKLAAAGKENPYSQTIAQIRHSKNAKTVSESIKKVSDKMTVDMTDPASPQDLSANLDRAAGRPVLTPEEAQTAFATKDDPAIKKALETVSMAEKSGNGRKVTEAAVQLIKETKKRARAKKTAKLPTVDTTNMEDFPVNFNDETHPESKVAPSLTKLTPTNTSEPQPASGDTKTTNSEPNVAPSVPQLANDIADAASESFTPAEGSHVGGSERRVIDLDRYGNSGDESSPERQNRQATTLGELVNPAHRQPVTEEPAIFTSSTGARGNTPLDPPKFVAKEFFKNIDDGLDMRDTNPEAYYFSKALDDGLKGMLGPNYRSDAKLPEILGSFFRKFSDERNKEGREITQPKDVIDMRATGDFKGEQEAFDKRNAIVRAHPAGEGGDMSATDLATLGIEPGEEGGGAFEGMQVRPEHQDENMVHDLTRGEDMLSALFSEDHQGAAAAVRAVKRLFLGGFGNTGMRSVISGKHPMLRSKSVSLDALEKEAEKVDATKARNNVTDTRQENDLGTKSEASQKLRQIVRKYLDEAKLIAEAPKTNASGRPLDKRTQMLLQVRSALEKEPALKKKFEQLYKVISKKDGAGGPGVHDGAGGPGFFSGIADAISAPFGNTVSYNRATPQVMGTSTGPTTPSQYNIRGINESDDDLKEVGNILYGEISNRNPDRQDFEVNNIVNTAINRSMNPGPDKGKSIADVMKRKFQYQGYAPEGMTVHGGKVIPSQYQKVVAGTIDDAGKAKLQRIMDSLNKMKTGKFDDTTGGSMFYVHASDGTMWLGKSIKEAKQRATDHETQKGSKVTQWGTAVGLPATTTP